MKKILIPFFALLFLMVANCSQKKIGRVPSSTNYGNWSQELASKNIRFRVIGGKYLNPGEEKCYECAERHPKEGNNTVHGICFTNPKQTSGVAPLEKIESIEFYGIYQMDKVVVTAKEIPRLRVRRFNGGSAGNKTMEAALYRFDKKTRKRGLELQATDTDPDFGQVYNPDRFVSCISGLDEFDTYLNSDQSISVPHSSEVKDSTK